MPRIFIAEDDPDHAQFLRRALVSVGHQTTLAGDGAEALRALAQGGFDLLLADIKMPVLDGVALTLKVVKEYPDTRIILMTGYSEEAKRAGNLKTLISDLITKPLTAEQVADAVDRALAT